jgi:hypothetical protein
MKPRYRVIHLDPYYTRAQVDSPQSAERVVQDAGQGTCVVLDRVADRLYRIDPGNVWTSIFQAAKRHTY